MSKRKSAPERSTSYCFTINNATDEDHRNVLELQDRGDVVQLVAEDEVGSEGTQHIQGYIRFSKRIYKNTLSIWLNRRAHIERSKGTSAQNYVYCTKEGAVFVQKGFEETVEKTIKAQKRKQEQNQEALEILHDIGALTEKEFILKHPKYYLRSRKDYLTFKAQFDMENTVDYEGLLSDKNYWLYGSAGTGKSILPSQWDEANRIIRKTSNKWFDGYQKYHHIIVIDDIAPGINDQTARNIKNLADRYKFVVEVKNGTLVVSPNDFCLVITSNYTIEQIFNNPEDIDPIKRRFKVFNVDEVKKLGATIDPPPFLEVIKQRNIPVAGADLIAAIKEIGDQVRMPKSQLELAAEEKNQRESQLKKSREEQARRIENWDFRKLRGLTRSQKIHQYKEHGYTTSEAEDAIDMVPSEESETEDWRLPAPPKYKPSEVEISQFSDVTPTSEEEEATVSYDCVRNHSQTIRSSDPLLELLKSTSEESSTDIDIETSSD